MCWETIFDHLLLLKPSLHNSIDKLMSEINTYWVQETVGSAIFTELFLKRKQPRNLKIAKQAATVELFNLDFSTQNIISCTLQLVLI